MVGPNSKLNPRYCDKCLRLKCLPTIGKEAHQNLKTSEQQDTLQQHNNEVFYLRVHHYLCGFLLYRFCQIWYRRTERAAPFFILHRYNSKTGCWNCNPSSEKQVHVILFKEQYQLKNYSGKVVTPLCHIVSEQREFWVFWRLLVNHHKLWISCDDQFSNFCCKI